MQRVNNAGHPGITSNDDITVTPGSKPMSGTDYRSVNNPYANSYIKQTAWDRFVNGLGFQSGYDKSEALRKSNYDIWESENAEKIRQEKYNSAEEVVDRERAAGLNPNLSGTALGEGAATDAAPDPTLSESSDIIADSMNGISDFGEKIASAVNLALSLSTGFAEVQGVNLSNDAKDIANLQSLFGFTESAISKFSTTMSPVDGSDLSPSEVQNLLGASFKKFVGDQIPRKYHKRVNSIFQRMVGSNYGKKLLADSITDYGDSLVQSSGRQPIVQGFQRDYMTDSFKPLTDVTQRISKAQIDAYEIANSLLAKQSVKTELSESEAAEQAAENAKAQKRIQEILNQAVVDCLEKLQEDTKSDKWLVRNGANSLLLTLGAVNMTGIPSVGIGGRSSGSSAAAPGGYTPQNGNGWSSSTSW